MLYPIIRRVRRPLLPVEESQTVAPADPVSTPPLVEPEVKDSKLVKTPDDSADQNKQRSRSKKAATAII